MPGIRRHRGPVGPGRSQGDLDITLHALQETGKLNVLSRPYVLTRNNRLATITVADEVPIPTGTTTVAGQTQVTFDYRNDIGIVLDVTPSINDEGLVNMIVSPKITTQNGDGSGGREPGGRGVLHAFGQHPRRGPRRPDHRDRRLDPGPEQRHRPRKVPLLGDIPIVGNLFKRKIIEKSKTELLIFLTPYVAKEPADLTKISDTEERRSTLSQDKDAAELYRRHMNAMRNEEMEPNQPK